MTPIHPTAAVAPSARLAPDVEVGPFCVVGPEVELGAGCRLLSHVVVAGPSRLGAGNVFHPGSVIGGDPQDLSFHGERVTLEVGDDNLFRECVTVNRGTTKAGGVTRIGHRNLLMAYCHVAHDCVLEDDIVMANAVQLGGHIRVEEGVGLGGGAMLHHFVSVGRWAFVGGLSAVHQDVPPYTIADGNPAQARALNLVGLKRRGLAPERVEALKEAYKAVFRSGVARAEVLARLEKKDGLTDEVRRLLRSLRASFAGKQGRALEALRTW